MPYALSMLYLYMIKPNHEYNLLLVNTKTYKTLKPSAVVCGYNHHQDVIPPSLFLTFNRDYSLFSSPNPHKPSFGMVLKYNVKVSTHSCFNEGMDDPPLDQLPPNVVH